MASMKVLVLNPLLFVVALVAVDLPLKLTYFLWQLFMTGTTAVARLGCLGCLLALPFFGIYLVISIVTIPSFVIMFLIEWLDLKLGLTGKTRLEIAQQSFFWPHILVFLLMPRVYRVSVDGTGPYALTDLETGEVAFVMPGPQKVTYGPSELQLGE